MVQMIQILTIVLDGMPYIERHLATFEALKTPWRWTIVEGVAKPVNCTAWCKDIPARLSQDGTTEYLETLKTHPNVTVIQRAEWRGKVEMLNAGLASMKTAGVLLEVDADELWTSAQIDRIYDLFKARHELGAIYFYCHYFVGPDIVAVTPNAYGNNSYEWLRAWRMKGGAVFEKHEPPIYGGNAGRIMSREESRSLGLVFRHMAYATETAVAFKEVYYGYPGAVAAWRRLQANTRWPVPLKQFLPWSDERAMVDQFNPPDEKPPQPTQKRQFAHLVQAPPPQRSAPGPWDPS